MNTRCYTPSVSEIRRYVNESLHATNRLAVELAQNEIALAYLKLIRGELCAALCNIDLAGSQLAPPPVTP